MKKLSIIIVNRDAGFKLENCIRSVSGSDYDDNNIEIIVVDNMSSDGSLQLIENISPLVKIIKNNKNYGFGKACNIALKETFSEYVLMLNPDVILMPDTLRKCIEFMDKNKDIDVLGIKNLNLNGNIAKSCSRFPKTRNFIYDMTGLSKLFPRLFKPATIMTDLDHKESRFVDQVIGAFMLIRLSRLEITGFFDERFFMYYEDLDLSKRIKKSGGKIYYNSEISIIHEGGGTTANILAKRLFYSNQSRIKYCKKYNEEFSLSLIILISVLVEPFVRLLSLIIKLNFKEIPQTIHAYYLYYRWLLVKK